jgi:hypothetical protein
MAIMEDKAILNCTISAMLGVVESHFGDEKFPRKLFAQSLWQVRHRLDAGCGFLPDPIMDLRSPEARLAQVFQHGFDLSSSELAQVFHGCKFTDVGPSTA